MLSVAKSGRAGRHGAQGSVRYRQGRAGTMNTQLYAVSLIRYQRGRLADRYNELTRVCQLILECHFIKNIIFTIFIFKLGIKKNVFFVYKKKPFLLNKLYSFHGDRSVRKTSSPANVKINITGFLYPPCWTIIYLFLSADNSSNFYILTAWIAQDRLDNYILYLGCIKKHVLCCVISFREFRSNN